MGNFSCPVMSLPTSINDQTLQFLQTHLFIKNYIFLTWIGSEVKKITKTSLWIYRLILKVTKELFETIVFL